VPDLVSDFQVRFEPPDDKWRSYLQGVTINAVQAVGLSVYLVDVRENRLLRSNQRFPDYDAGFGVVEHAPPRVDCHYLISAWDIVSATQSVEPTLTNEHRVLSDVVTALMQASPINPSRILPPGPVLQAIPEAMRNVDLQTAVLPVEGFPKLAEFWSSMGVGARWRPAVYLVVTVPVVLERSVVGPLVTTANVLVRGGDEFFLIGGTVYSTATGKAPVGNAWVRVDETGAVYTTDGDGRFRTDWLNRGHYGLTVRATGFQEATPTITVPEPTGRYDFALTPL
jgi:hypothetical protein